MKTIVGVFDNAREAESAAADLVSSGFPRGDVKVVEEKAAPGLAAGDPVDLLLDYGLPQDDATAYVEEIHDGGALLAVKAQDAQAPRAMDILRRHGLREDMTGLESASAAAGATLTEEQLKAGETIPVVEEQIRVGKRLIRRGGVLVHTHVTETPVEEQVTLREEKVKLERHPTDRPVTPADMAAFKAISRNLSGRDWDAIDMDAKRRWEELNPGTWGRYEPAIHYAWNHVRGLR
jgi:hypothetical protein